jgi:conjugal transfer pilus assembly protein TraK
MNILSNFSPAGGSKGRPKARSITIALALLTTATLAWADGMPTDPDAEPQLKPNAAKSARTKQVNLANRANRVDRDPLKVDAQISVRQEPIKALDLPGVLKLEGADANVLDPTRVREVHWRNRGAVTVWISDHQVNRIQLPFANPRVVATDTIKIDKRAASNNVYVHYEKEPVADQVWFEPPGESSVSIGLQLVPKNIPAQDIVVIDDTVESTASRAKRAGSENDYLTRTQALMEQAGLGASPAGFAEVELQVPALAANGLSVQGLRRLSSRSEDIYVYELGNPGRVDREVREEEFDGENVLAVSILPKPLLRPNERAILVVLAKKREVR